MSDLLPWLAPWSGRVLVGLVVLLGLAIAWLGARRRRNAAPRCPRCRYDLLRAAEHLCPECGWRPASPTDPALFRGPRRRGLIALGLLIAIAAPTSVTARRMRQFGWDYYLTFGVGYYFFGHYTADSIELGNGVVRIVGDRAFAFTKDLEFQSGSEEPTTIAEVAHWSLSRRNDLTADHRSFVVADVSSGGAHCCQTVYIFAPDDAGDLQIIDTVDVQNGGTLRDKDGDGVVELVTCDWTWAYALTCYACLRHPEVIMRFDGVHFVPAPDLMIAPNPPPLRDRLSAIDRAQAQRPGAQGGLDALSSEMLELIYTGRSTDAWTLAERAWTNAWGERSEFLAKFRAILTKSSWLPSLKSMNPDDDVLWDQ